MVKGELYANELKIRENICSKRGPWYTLMLLGVKGGREVWDTCIMRAKDLKSQFAWLKEGELNFIQIAEKFVFLSSMLSTVIFPHRSPDGGNGS